MINPEIINDRLREITENIALLEESIIIPFEKFRGDPKTIKYVERCLQISIQCIVDICHHLIVENNWTRPRDNKEALAIIAEQGIIPPIFAERLEPMIGLRNLLVHEYLKIDPARIYDHLSHLDDFRLFQKHIVEYLKAL